MKLLTLIFFTLLLIGSAGGSHGQSSALTEQLMALKNQKAQLEDILQQSYSPEAIRRRVTRAMLDGGAQVGLGGMGRGKALEEEKIRAEKLQITTLLLPINQQIIQVNTLISNQRNENNRINEQNRVRAQTISEEAIAKYRESLAIKDNAPAAIADEPNEQNRVRAESIVEGLKELNQLYEEGALNNDEFMAAKKILLGI
ncbi:MAG: hypothetical protein O3A56_09835 [Proteobacteria bacterium]|nr:hypothetical protein [Pseudomonadota bacterium]